MRAVAMAAGRRLITTGSLTTLGKNMDDAKKSLGQHWLNDKASLKAMVEAANVRASDTILEIGSGYGALTRELLATGAKVVAIEKDESLAAILKYDNLEVIVGDVLEFDFGTLPADYKIAANIPYYITAHLLRLLGETTNKPAKAALLVQKEVAERVCAAAGEMSILAVSVQLFYEPSLGKLVPAHLFTPPPKVDSQILTLSRRAEPLFTNLDVAKYMRIVRAGFGEKRKKLRSSLAGGLGVSKAEADSLLEKAGINGDLRAQNLGLEDWHKLYQALSI